MSFMNKGEARSGERGVGEGGGVPHSRDGKQKMLR